LSLANFFNSDETETIFSIPESDVVNERYNKENFSKFALSPCFIKYDSDIEKEFAKYLDNSEKVIWWYKNGEGYGKYLGILYTDSEGKERTFYPDFIVKTTDKTWIIDTKCGWTTDASMEKRDALRQWLKDKPNFDGGIVVSEANTWKIFRLNEEQMENAVCDSGVYPKWSREVLKF